MTERGGGGGWFFDWRERDKCRGGGTGNPEYSHEITKLPPLLTGGASSTAHSKATLSCMSRQEPVACQKSVHERTIPVGVAAHGDGDPRSLPNSHSLPALPAFAPPATFAGPARAARPFPTPSSPSTAYFHLPPQSKLITPRAPSLLQALLPSPFSASTRRMHGAEFLDRSGHGGVARAKWHRSSLPGEAGCGLNVS